MENYQTYTTEDFVLDQEFRSWVKNPTQELDAFWQEWLRTNPEKQDIIEKAIYIITHLPTEAASSLSTAERMHLINLIEDGIDERSSIAFDKKEETIVVQLKIVPQTPLARKQVHSGNWTWRIAASVFIVLGLGLYFFKFNSHPEEKTITPVTLIEEQNPNGKKSVVLLKDGSRITLNADSKISYPQNFATNRRQVHLEGEAFFEVAKDASRPFEVITGDIKTVALGTSFNIRAYPEDRNISVALATGKVNIQYDKTRALLETLIPGQQIVYQRASGVVKKEQVPQEDISPWKTGVLRFDHAKQEEVFKQLERWYGVRFKIENENKLPVDVNGKFEDVSVENVMEVLRYSMKFKFTKEEDLITIHYEN